MKRVTRKEEEIKVKVTFTEGYEKRFTMAMLKYYERLQQKKENDTSKVS